METPSLIEEIRFGYGPRLGARLGAGFEPDRLLAQLEEPFPLPRPPLSERWAAIEIYTNDRKNGLLKDGAKKAHPATRDLIAMEAEDEVTWVLRPTLAEATFAERLTELWANRITVAAPSPLMRHFVQSFRDEAIRPHIGGKLADLLKATLWHPAMQIYLTQNQSFGPNSRAGKRHKKGLNENLAREFLELHTMGHGYSQTDVIELARLLAGMKSDAEGQRVEDARTEPGVKTILGTRFKPGEAEIDRLVDLVARRPETARSTAFFVARHFIADVPPEDLVDAMAAAYLKEDTSLPALYRALLTHPAAQSPEFQKLRRPQELIIASLRILGMNGREKGLRGFKKEGLRLPDRLRAMGQPTWNPARPDGWAETSPAWLTPPLVSARTDWAIDLGRAMGADMDPPALADLALGERASKLLRRATAGAEQRWEGVSVLLAAPEFSRR